MVSADTAEANELAAPSVIPTSPPSSSSSSTTRRSEPPTLTRRFPALFGGIGREGGSVVSPPVTPPNSLEKSDDTVRGRPRAAVPDESPRRSARGEQRGGGDTAVDAREREVHEWGWE